jgi:hypothetical protein
MSRPHASRLVREWNERALSTVDFVHALADQLRNSARGPIWEAERLAGYSRVIAILEDERRKGTRFQTIRGVVERLRQALDPERVKELAMAHRERVSAISNRARMLANSKFESLPSSAASIMDATTRRQLEVLVNIGSRRSEHLPTCTSIWGRSFARSLEDPGRAA